MSESEKKPAIVVEEEKSYGVRRLNVTGQIELPLGAGLRLVAAILRGWYEEVTRVTFTLYGLTKPTGETDHGEEIGSAVWDGTAFVGPRVPEEQRTALMGPFLTAVFEALGAARAEHAEAAAACCNAPDFEEDPDAERRRVAARNKVLALRAAFEPPPVPKAAETTAAPDGEPPAPPDGASKLAEGDADDRRF